MRMFRSLGVVVAVLLSGCVATGTEQPGTERPDVMEQVAFEPDPRARAEYERLTENSIALWGTHCGVWSAIHDSYEQLVQYQQSEERDEALRLFEQCRKERVKRFSAEYLDRLSVTQNKHIRKYRFLINRALRIHWGRTPYDKVYPQEPVAWTRMEQTLYLGIEGDEPFVLEVELRELLGLLCATPDLAVFEQIYFTTRRYGDFECAPKGWEDPQEKIVEGLKAMKAYEPLSMGPGSKPIPEKLP